MRSPGASLFIESGEPAGLVDALGTSDFYERLASFSARLAPLCAFSAYRVSRERAPELRLRRIPRALLHRRTVSLDAYGDWAYRVDPAYRGFRRGVRTGLYRYTDLADTSPEHARFDREFYSHVDARDELSILVHLADGTGIVLYLMRSALGEPFATEDTRRLGAQSALIVAAVRQHERLRGLLREAPIDGRLRDARAHFARSCVSPREHEVLGLLLEGQEESSVAEALRISEATVRNHRKSIYRKLGVGSRRALTARFLACADDPIALATGRAPTR